MAVTMMEVSDGGIQGSLTWLIEGFGRVLRWWGRRPLSVPVAEIIFEDGGGNENILQRPLGMLVKGLVLKA